MLRAGVVECKTVRLGVFRVKEGAGDYRCRFARIKGGVKASLKPPSEWHGNFHNRHHAPALNGCRQMGGGEDLLEEAKGADVKKKQ